MSVNVLNYEYYHQRNSLREKIWIFSNILHYLEFSHIIIEHVNDNILNKKEA